MKPKVVKSERTKTVTLLFCWILLWTNTIALKMYINHNSDKCEFIHDLCATMNSPWNSLEEIPYLRRVGCIYTFLVPFSAYLVNSPFHS